MACGEIDDEPYNRTDQSEGQPNTTSSPHSSKQNRDEIEHEKANLNACEVINDGADYDGPPRTYYETCIPYFLQRV